ncbi:U2 small nuclear ribonucleoprotein A'-like [Tubulanus polymorphus]|uniref:U2 small nuclear ribonucleoprotein A'-like n=1 Tax=Tubulanus polymorphus TaxID=672921 RepID=UPI003DA3FF98
MVKLTPELIEQSAQFTNPVRDRELDLRGYKIPVIENLGATLDQFDTIDLSDNDIRKVDGFPLLNRLKTVLLNNNRVVRIGENLEECLPHLDSIILTNNNIQELGDIDVLSTVKTLSSLSLMRNPVSTKKHYRLYVIHKLPQLRLLDFRKIKMKEREAATQMFKGKRGQKLVQDIVKKTKTFVPGATIQEKKQPEIQTGPSEEEISAIKHAIANATTLEEVERLTQLLRSGQVPGSHTNGSASFNRHADDEEMEYESNM